jgi:phenylalanine-4-hydroxylase
MAHDLLGHLPMLFSSSHREFLRALGRVMLKARSDERDRCLYAAQRSAALLRQFGEQPSPQLVEAEQRLAAVQSELRQAPSPLARLNRLYLWTVEFGLLGTAQSWVAYGAGLLSSPVELRQLMSGSVRVLPLSPDALQEDIVFSDPQRRYYVSRDYQQLQAELNREVSVCQ